jgi:hypothetical protein
MQSNVKKILTWIVLVSFFLFILVYAFFRAKDLIFGVKIRDVNLVNGTNSTESVVKVTGNAKNAIHLMLNGREISIDQDGNFEETIALLSGYNMVSIVGTDKFGNTDEENYQLTYSPEEIQ